VRRLKTYQLNGCGHQESSRAAQNALAANAIVVGCCCRRRDIVFSWRFWDIQRQNNGVTLNSGSEVTQSNWIWYHSKAWYGFLFTFHSNYGRIFSRFDTIHERDGQTPHHGRPRSLCHSVQAKRWTFRRRANVQPSTLSRDEGRSAGRLFNIAGPETEARVVATQYDTILCIYVQWKLTDSQLSLPHWINKNVKE